MHELLDQLIEPGHLVFLAAAIQAVALLFQGQVRIRFFLLIGSMVYLTYYMIAADEPLWEAMVATLAMSAANIYGLAALLMANTVRSIPGDQIALFSMFGGVEPWEFRSLMRHGQIRRLTENEALTTLGEVPENLYFIIDAGIEIEQGHGRFRIPPGHFIGEVSLVLGTPASATTHVKAGTQLVEWPRERLIRKMARQPKLMVTVVSLLSRDMGRKVAEGAGRIDKRFANTGPAPDFSR